jgi:hypothetical protein
MNKSLVAVGSCAITARQRAPPSQISTLHGHASDFNILAVDRTCLDHKACKDIANFINNKANSKNEFN